ncbi:MAG: alkaline phosphatase [Phormidesmis priestleyi]|uniref:Alkaline phosphatase n=1 Tax=Phormidesmis priestleyi TaxID=268141 RepID=A0A2W4XAX2_9CYAN|nr:MAG: alkaline phosphatase [Phormidesmis priestleyi]
MLDWITQAVTSFGYAGIAFMMFLENLIPPIPSELVMPLAGFAASQGQMDLWIAIAAGSIGSVLGALLWYYIGLILGLERLQALLDRYGRWVGLSAKDLDNAQRWFIKRGPWTVGLCRMVPGIRTYVSIPAGITRMPVGSFLLYSTVGTILWTAFLTLSGYFLGSEYERLGQWIAPVATAAIAIVTLSALIWIARRIALQSRT